MRHTKAYLLISVVALTQVIATSASSQETSRLARPPLPTGYELVDQEIQVVWKQFCAGLRSGNVAAALQSVSEVSRERYRPVLESIGARVTVLPDSWSQLQLLSLLGGDTAEYLIKETADGKEFVHTVIFSKSSEGSWVIEAF